MNQFTSGRRGFVLLRVLPWVVAGASVAAAAASWVALPSPSDPRSYEAADSGEDPTLRLALAAAQSENAALRQELDRLAASDRGVRGVRDDGVTADPTDSGIDETQRRDLPEPMKALASRLQRSASLAAAGDREALYETADALNEILQAGPDAFAALREAYLATPDPAARALMAPILPFTRGGDEALGLLLSELQQHRDPKLQERLLHAASFMVNASSAPVLEDAFLDAAASENDPATRKTALYGLRFAKDPEVERLFVRSASDPSEEVRLAAFDLLAKRPGTRERLRDLISSEPSPRLREIGQCRLLIAEAFGR